MYVLCNDVIAGRRQGTSSLRLDALLGTLFYKVNDTVDIWELW